jgi:hypothetical protein
MTSAATQLPRNPNRSLGIILQPGTKGIHHGSDRILRHRQACKQILIVVVGHQRPELLHKRV